jgi:hypothetical protein
MVIVLQEKAPVRPFLLVDYPTLLLSQVESGLPEMATSGSVIAYSIHPKLLVVLVFLGA